MLTYLVLNLAFMGMVLLRIGRSAISLPWPRIAILAAVLCICTAIFDSLIVAFDIVAYDTDRILGIYIGTAPVEDFFYSLLAAVIVPYLWKKYEG
jgi:lycopene cyclase domain-containing protein